MKKIIIGGITLSILILLGIYFTFDNQDTESAKAQTVQNDFSKKVKETNYMDKVGDRLRKEGYSVKYIMIENRLITITISDKKQENTDTNISSIVNQIAKDNGIGVFSVKIKTER